MMWSKKVIELLPIIFLHLFLMLQTKQDFVRILDHGLLQMP